MLFARNLAMLRIAFVAVISLILLLTATPAGAAPIGPELDGTSVSQTSSVSTAIAIGTSAPDFDFVSDREGWRSLRRMCARQPVLLVLDPDEQQLRTLQADYGTLAAMGVEPMAVLRQSDRANWALIEKLALRYSLLSDPAGVLAESFGARDGVTGAVRPAWFVVDQRGRVCAFERGTLPEGISPSVATALRGSDAPMAAEDDTP